MSVVIRSQDNRTKTHSCMQHFTVVIKCYHPTNAGHDTSAKHKQEQQGSLLKRAGHFGDHMRALLYGGQSCHFQRCRGLFSHFTLLLRLDRRLAAPMALQLLLAVAVAVLATAPP